MTKEEIIRYSQEFIHIVKSKGINLKYAYLFGSYAKNQQREHSDVDIALVADEFTGFGFIDIKLCAIELFDYDLIQVKTYNTEYFKKSDPFIEEIMKYAIPLKIN